MGIIGGLISGFMEGLTENDSPTDASLVPQAANDKGDITISSLNDMSKWLNSLQKGASPAVKEALTAQINVIRFVQSPTLVDTTFDTLLYSLDKSLRAAKSHEEKSEIQEVFCLMIQNYAFFMDAKYQMEVNKNQEEGRRLFVQAGELLTNSIKDIALLAIGGADVSEIANATITNLFAPADDSGGLTSFLGRLFNFFAKEDELIEQEQLFYVTIENIIRKLGEPNTQKLLGKSNLLAGTIQRYVPDLKDYCFNNNTTLYQLKESEEKSFKNGYIIGGIWLGGSFVVGICRYFFSFSWKAPWLGRYILWTVIVLAAILLISFIFRYPTTRSIKKEIKRLNDYFDSLYAIGESYKEPYDSQVYSPERTHLYSIVAKDEQEYIDIYKQYSGDGVISERDRKMLQKFSEHCGITAERARELEASCLKPKLTKDEQEYLEMYKEYAADDRISDRDRKMLDKMRDKMGIGEERAREIEKL